MDIKVDTHTYIVFDLDDTLYNELDYLRSSYKAIAQSINAERWPFIYASMFSRYRSGEDVFEWLATSFEIDKSELLAMYREHFPVIKPFPGVVELMKTIKAKGGTLGILTDGRSLTQRNKIIALSIEDLIDKIVISEELGTEKPNKNNFKCFEDPEKDMKYYYVADNFRKDFISPNALNWTTIGLMDNGKNIHTNGFKFMEEKYCPHFLVDSLQEIRIT